MRSSGYKEFLKFLNENRRLVNQDQRITNCRGTALYLVGEIEMDRHSLLEETQHILSNLNRFDGPDLGYIVEFEYSDMPIHLGVVVSNSPMELATRNGAEGPFYRSLDIHYLIDKFSPSRLNYYMPSKLERMIKI